MKATGDVRKATLEAPSEEPEILPPQHSFPDLGFLTLDQIVGKGRPIPISAATWYSWRKAKRAPQGIMMGGKRVYTVASIVEFIEDIELSGMTTISKSEGQS